MTTSSLPIDSARPAWTRDAVAGLCVAGLLLPEAVAYAGMAHLPLTHALTALLVGLLVYAALGGSRFAIVSPTSSTATLVAAAAVSMAGSDYASAAYVQTTMVLVLLSGAMLLLLGVARQGQLSSYISRPVLKGFAFALAFTIVCRQLPDALGFEPDAAATADPLHLLWFTVTHATLWHPATVAVAALAAGVLLLLRRWPVVPASLLVIVLAMAASQWLDLQAQGVHTIGSVPALVFQWEFPALPAADWMRASELAFGLVMLTFAESWGSVRTLALPHGDALDANRELMVLGACNLGAALLQGMPVGAGFSGSTANAAAGAQSRKAGAIAFAASAVLIVFALPHLHLLPRPVLAVAVISALWHALSLHPLRAVWRLGRDRGLLLGAVLAVLLLGVLHGMLVAIGLSLLGALYRFSQPVLHELGALEGGRNYVDVAAQHGALACPGLLILRPEEPLFFASAERVNAQVLERVRSAGASVRVVILSLEESADLDSTAADCLLELRQALLRQGRTLLLARVKTTVRNLLAQCDGQGLGAPSNVFWAVADAVDFAQALRKSPAPAV